MLTGVNHIKHCYIIDQRPIGRSRTSCPATYTGIFDRIRDLFAETDGAKKAGYSEGMFSGKQIISEEYIRQAVSPLKCNPNYGFL